MDTSEWLFPNRATPPGSSTYYSIRFSPAELRDDLAAIVGWRWALRSVLSDCSDPGVARLKIDWWRSELQRTFAGNPRHPLTQRLAGAIGQHRLPVAPFLALADTVESDILRHSPATSAALCDYCERDLGVMFDLLGRCGGARDPAQIACLRRLGTACDLIYLVRDTGLHLRTGRCFIPADRLRQAGLNRENLRAASRRPLLKALLSGLANEARTLSAGQRHPVPATIAARTAMVLALLDAIEDSGFEVLDRHIGLPPIRKLWIGWKASHCRNPP